MAPRAWLVAVALAIGALCWGLGAYPLLEPDEGRNAEVAREMARSGDFVLPHLNGLPYLDKPAPYFAAVALSLRAFGETEGAARLPSLLFILATTALVFGLGRKMGGPVVGAVAAAAFASMPLVLGFSRTVIFDSALACIEALTLAGAWRGFSAERAGWRWFALAWAAMGIGAVTKGPVAIVVPLLIVTAFAFAARVPLRPFFTWRAWPWLLVTALPWFVAVSFRRPDFPHYALIYESLERLLTRTHGRAGPIWYFIPVALVGAFPWIAPALAGVGLAWRERARWREPAARPVLFVLAWALVPFIFFSLSQSKLPGYYLPALPGVALGVGLVFARALDDAAARTTLAKAVTVAGGLMGLIGVALLVLADRAFVQVPLTPLTRLRLPGLTLGLGTALVLSAALGIAAARLRHVWLMTVALVIPVAAAPFVSARFMAALGGDRSSKELAAAIEAAAPGVRVVGVEAYPTSLRWYLDRPVLLASGTGVEMTSNYVASRFAEFSAAPATPLRSLAWWRTALAACDTATVFVGRRGRATTDSLAAALPLIAAGGADAKFVAYGPCRPGATPPAPSPGGP